MPPPDHKLAGHMAEAIHAEQKRRFNAGATMDRWPASTSDLIWCAIALLESGLVVEPVQPQPCEGCRRKDEVLRVVNGCSNSEGPGVCSLCRESIASALAAGGGK